jgi:hypothetical protein
MTVPPLDIAPHDTPAAPGPMAGLERPDAQHLVHANIHPQTGLATDYLNHFNEAVMLLEMIPEMPECIDDFLAWRPLSYRAHFMASGFKAKDLAVHAYEAADPALRAAFDDMTATMTTILTTAAAAMRHARTTATHAALAGQAAAEVKPLLMLAGALINGGRSGAADIDRIMEG